MPAYVPHLLKETVVYPPDHTYPLHVIANRYRLPDKGEDERGLTLICMHSTSFHKETWEPTLERLFECVERSDQLSIREAWSIEVPNHGESALLNENALTLPEFSNNCASFNFLLPQH